MAKKPPLLASLALLSGVGTTRTAENVLIWWGSGPGGNGATIGDRDAVDNLSTALLRAGFPHEVLSAPEVAGPRHRTIANLEFVAGGLKRIVFVCGPLPDGGPFLRFLARSPKARKIAVGVSVIPGRERFAGPFDAILARDGGDGGSFDLALAGFDGDPAIAARQEHQLCATCFAGRQKEYGAGATLGERSRDMIARAAADVGVATAAFDTILQPRNGPSEIAAAIWASRFVATTRMHGALYALAHGRPVVAVDQVPGGAKVSAVVGRTGWPLVLRADEADGRAMREAFERAVDPAIDGEVGTARARALELSRATLETAAAFVIANAG